MPFKTRHSLQSASKGELASSVYTETAKSVVTSSEFAGFLKHLSEDEVFHYASTIVPSHIWQEYQKCRSLCEGSNPGLDFHIKIYRLTSTLIFCNHGCRLSFEYCKILILIGLSHLSVRILHFSNNHQKRQLS